MTEVGHKDETVRDQGLFILFYVYVALSSVLFVFCSCILLLRCVILLSIISSLSYSLIPTTCNVYKIQLPSSI